MAIEASILKTTKKAIGIDPNYEVYDPEITMFINSVISQLTQLGIGPEAGFMIEDSTATWDSFIGSDPRLNLVKTYVHLRVRLLFDAPPTSYAIESMKEQVRELEWRLNVHREGESWEDPNPPTP